MGTQFETADGEVVAKRMSQGAGKKPAFRVFFTKEEFVAWMGVPCAPEDDPSDMRTFMEWFNVQSATAEVHWMTAADMNDAAHQMENHRWAEMFGTAPAEMRSRARQASRDQMRVVK